MDDGSGHFPFGAGREAMKVPQATVIAATANRRDAQGHMHQRGCLGRHSRISRHRRVAGGCKSAYHQENDHFVDVLGLPPNGEPNKYDGAPISSPKKGLLPKPG